MPTPDPDLARGVGEPQSSGSPESAGSAGSPNELPPGVSGPPGVLQRLIRDQRVLFLIVGGLNTVIGTIWFALFDWLLGYRWNGLGHYPALVCAYIAAILCAFVLYRRLVFRVRGHVLRDLLRFSTVYLSAFVINLVLLFTFVHGFHWHPFLSQCLIVFVTTSISWVGHNKYSFKRPPRDPEAAGSTESGEPGPTMVTQPNPER